MRTIYLSRNGVIAACVFVFIIIATCYIYTNNSEDEGYQQSNLLPRDAQVRRKFEQSDPTEANGHDFEDGFAVKENTENKAVARPPDNSEDTHSLDSKRREKVVEMIRHAWQGYRNYTFGKNELRPISHTANNQDIFGGPQMMATVVDGADTLYLAGLKKEYEEARDLIRDKFDIQQTTSSFSVFEVTIRHVGGFLALYALTNESFYLDKAKSIVDSLLPAFDTPSGIPKSLMNVHRGTAANYNWAYGSSILSEVGSLHLELKYLSHLTNDQIYLEKVEKLRNALDKANRKDGFYKNYISPDTGQFVSEDVSIGAMGDSFYEYLIKEWIQSNRTDMQSIRMYREASKVLRERLAYKSDNNLTYIAEVRAGVVEHKMGHLACFAPGMFALEAIVEEDEVKKAEIMEFAEELGRTCHVFYEETSTGIGPEMAYFEDGKLTIRNTENGYILRPESMEGWFYLWRITRKPVYKEWIWNAIMAIDKYCRVPGGFAGLKNVNHPDEGFDDVQQTFFIAETLKYAYLTFADEILPFEKWVFNTEAHAFPIL